MADRTHDRSPTHDPAIDRPRSVENLADNDPPSAGQAPGAISSPQAPGQVPDRSTIPGQGVTRVPRVQGPVLRPLTEYGTAQAIMDVFAVTPGQEMNPARFEQATASYEEMRKAYPAQLPPDHPGPGYALEGGDAMASELQAVDGPKPVPPAPAVPTGEAVQATPGTVGEVAPAARIEAPAAEVGSAFSPSGAPASVRSPSDAVAGSGAAGESRWSEAAPKPGDASSPAGTLPTAKDGETNAGQGRAGTLPPEAPQ